MFSLRIDVYVHQANETAIEQKLQFIGDTLSTLASQGAIMAGELQALQAKVDEMVAEAADNQAKFDSVAGTLTALIAKLIELQGQPQALLDMAALLDSTKQAMDASQSSIDDEVAAAQAVLNPPAP